MQTSGYNIQLQNTKKTSRYLLYYLQRQNKILIHFKEINV